MVYITISKEFISGEIYTSFNNWLPISINKYDFELNSNLFFYFDCEEILYMIKLKDFLILEDKPILQLSKFNV